MRCPPFDSKNIGSLCRALKIRSSMALQAQGSVGLHSHESFAMANVEGSPTRIHKGLSSDRVVFVAVSAIIIGVLYQRLNFILFVE
jgi:hypothetical protein